MIPHAGVFSFRLLRHEAGHYTNTLSESTFHKSWGLNVPFPLALVNAAGSLVAPKLRGQKHDKEQTRSEIGAGSL